MRHGPPGARAPRPSAAARRRAARHAARAGPAPVRRARARVAVRGWIGSNTEMALAWLDAGEPPLAHVVRLMVTVLVAALRGAGLDAGVLAALTREAGAALAA